LAAYRGQGVRDSWRGMGRSPMAQPGQGESFPLQPLARGSIPWTWMRPVPRADARGTGRPRGPKAPPAASPRAGPLS
jgi:hypothetical protein